MTWLQLTLYENG